jgi:hypothetical protein
MTPLLLFPGFQGLDGGFANHASRGNKHQREISVSRSDDADDGGTKPELSYPGAAPFRQHCPT